MNVVRHTLFVSYVRYCEQYGKHTPLGSPELSIISRRSSIAKTSARESGWLVWRSGM